ncbi:MAG TPA: YlzJ-like family protein [Bacilli bacterium]|nr:YlzJ-like family protein [Bacilli bacterium]
MLFWSTVPPEHVFDGYDKQTYNWVEHEVGGVKMLVEPMQEQPGYARIVRLLCPNPQSYLNPNHAPGSTVRMY